MLGRTTPILIVGFVFLALVAPAASAYQNVNLPTSDNNPYPDKVRPILIHLIMINTTDVPLNNINPPADSHNLKWVHLVYSYENIGDRQIKGYINVSLRDSNGNEYHINDYTGESVLPQTITDPKYVEIPVPRNAEITHFIIRQGFEETVYSIPKVTITPAPSLIATSTTVTPTPDGGHPGVDGCLPFIPFAMAGGLAAAGMVINRSGIRRRLR